MNLSTIPIIKYIKTRLINLIKWKVLEMDANNELTSFKLLKEEIKFLNNQHSNLALSLEQQINRLNDLNKCLDKQVDELKIFKESSPKYYKLFKGLSKSLKPGLVSPNALFASSLCRLEDHQHPRYSEICEETIKEVPRLHRKQWEFIYIIEKLSKNNCLIFGKRGLGFGVGTEPLPSYFVSKGCSILATDAPEDSINDDWKKTYQHSSKLSDLWRKNIVEKDLFEKSCSFKPLDMNAYHTIPHGFDFHWSSCVIEHLGGISAAQKFLLESVQKLAPGGLAVHTTEFNLSSDSTTMELPGTCILRASDINNIVLNLEEHGYFVDPIILDPGTHPYNFHVDVPPYTDNLHLRLELLNYTATSIGIVIRKPD